MRFNAIAYAGRLLVTDKVAETVLNRIETAVSQRFLCGGKS